MEDNKQATYEYCEKYVNDNFYRLSKNEKAEAIKLVYEFVGMMPVTEKLELIINKLLTENLNYKKKYNKEENNMFKGIKNAIEKHSMDTNLNNITYAIEQAFKARGADFDDNYVISWEYGDEEEPRSVTIEYESGKKVDYELPNILSKEEINTFVDKVMADIDRDIQLGTEGIEEDLDEDEEEYEEDEEELEEEY